MQLYATKVISKFKNSLRLYLGQGFNHSLLSNSNGYTK